MAARIFAGRTSFRPKLVASHCSRRQKHAWISSARMHAVAKPEEALESFEHLDEISEAVHVMTIPDFLPCANDLREAFDQNFEDPRKLHMNRFCWDYWHVPGQYTLLRTPAQDYFAEEDYAALENALLTFGKEQLGCVGLTPIWLSYYIDGCRQELHCDNVHGPWAFVLSLTDWESRKFSGGETFLLTDLVLNYWATFASDTVIEADKLVRAIEPHFNQLTVFDPRIPHGVRRVEGVHEPTDGRIVLHGWFVEPEMFVEGAMPFEDAKTAVDACIEEVMEHIGELPEATGTIVTRIDVEGNGNVQNFKFLTDTLVARPWDVRENDSSTARARIQLAIRNAFCDHTFPLASGPSTITYPILFE